MNAIELAKEAALSKVRAEGCSCFYSHGFTLFNHDNQVNRLKGILRYGIISGSFARRVGLSWEGNYLDHRREKYVFLNYQHDYASSLGTAAALTAVEIKSRVPANLVLAVMINPQIHTDRKVSYGGELLRRHRVDPKDFRALMIVDTKQVRVIHGETIDDPYMNYEDMNPEQIAEGVVANMLETYKDRPDFSLPIFGNSNSLYWPLHVNNSDLFRIFPHMALEELPL